MSARPVTEVFLIYLGVCVATFVASQVSRVGFGDYEHLIVGGVFLFTALHMAGIRGGLRHHGVALEGVLSPPESDEAPGPFGVYELGRTLRDALPSAVKETGIALALALLIFPPFAVGFYYFHGPTMPFRWSLPDDLLAFALTQAFVIALPEEAFFRGYVQTRLSDAWGRKSLGKVELCIPAWVLSAVLFALVHLVASPNPQRLAVFFPGLLFGLLRAWRGGIGAAIVFHTLSNVYSDLLIRGWFAP